MKKRTKSNWQNTAFAFIASVAFVFAFFCQAAAQKGNFKAGDQVEIKAYDYFETWYPAEILELRSDGRYKVRYKDGGVIDTVEVKKIRLVGKAPTAVGDQNVDDKRNNTEPPTESKNTASKFKPGDRVECDKAQIGRWEKGTVVHFRPNDSNKDTGKYYRVKLDSFKTYYPEGHECYASFIRPINEPSLKATGKYKIGDRIEAHDYSGAWLPAKIVAVEGAFYKVSLDSYDDSYDQWVDDERIRRPLGTAANEKQNPPIDTQPTIPAEGATKLPGTSWKVTFYDKGKTAPTGPKGVPMLMLFCPDGKWDNVRYGLTPGAASAVGMRGKYRVSGSQLTTTSDTGTKGVYKMTWIIGGKIIDLDSGSGLIMRLFYNGETQCKQ